MGFAIDLSISHLQLMNGFNSLFIGMGFAILKVKRAQLSAEFRFNSLFIGMGFAIILSCYRTARGSECFNSLFIGMGFAIRMS